jgi:hypothetical protein
MVDTDDAKSNVSSRSPLRTSVTPLDEEKGWYVFLSTSSPSFDPNLIIPRY